MANASRNPSVSYKPNLSFYARNVCGFEFNSRTFSSSHLKYKHYLPLSGEFSCEIQRDGKVCVRGVTSTGGKIVQKYSRVYEMKFQQQSPPGPFKLFFSLPGAVDPRLFSPHFRPDGIFEAVVAKYE